MSGFLEAYKQAGLNATWVDLNLDGDFGQTVQDVYQQGNSLFHFWLRKLSVLMFRDTAVRTAVRLSSLGFCDGCSGNSETTTYSLSLLTRCFIDALLTIAVDLGLLTRLCATL